MKFKLIALLTLLLIAIVPAYGNNDDLNVLRNVEILENTNPQCESGFIKTWTRVTVKLEDGTIDRFYHVFLSDDKNLRVGARYDFWYRYEVINSYLSDEAGDTSKKKAIKHYRLILSEETEKIQSDNPMDDAIKLQVNKLRNYRNNESRKALISLHKWGKESIPYLIDDMDNSEIIFLHINAPWNSNLTLLALCNYAGVMDAYVVELILARDDLAEDPEDKEIQFLFRNKDNYIYWDGVLERNDKIPLNARDMENVKDCYAQWWDTHKDQSISELRKLWLTGKRPLTGTNYSWR